ncbi:MAG: hypothetical protein G01um101472_186 [Parcubacteria group bacterium Gr01-1014_72]|nr:MAG: hypothetical protein G01um101472_186 [Parcubacteria group bacterium Gr01-1014_72]
MTITAVLIIVGRVLLGGYFLMNAYNHLRRLEQTAGYAKFKGVPSPTLATAVTGLLLLLGGLSILLGVRPLWGIVALLVFFVPVTFKMHAFWKETDGQAKIGEQVNFMKNLAIIGALLIMLAIPLPWEYSLQW